MPSNSPIGTLPRTRNKEMMNIILGFDSEDGDGEGFAVVEEKEKDAFREQPRPS